jgi:CNT family concentrative nucleoside transporter
MKFLWWGSGIFLFFFLPWILGDRGPIKHWRRLLGFLISALSILFLGLKTEALKGFFNFFTAPMNGIQAASQEGASFVFGYLSGRNIPFIMGAEGSGFIFAFQALPIIIVMSALFGVLSHWGVLRLFISGFSWIFRKVFAMSGIIGAYTGGKFFLSQLECPLLIRPYLGTMGRSELFAIITMGMSTTSLLVLIIYGSILDQIPHVRHHLLMAHLAGIPISLWMSTLIIPPHDENQGSVIPEGAKTDHVMDALAQGANDGFKIVMAIIPILIATVGLVALVNMILSHLIPGVTVQSILGWLGAPFVWAMGIPWSEAHVAGSLWGTKTALNEMIAYMDLSKTSKMLSERSSILMVYALCGFCNLSSIAMVIGSLGTLIPQRRGIILSLVGRGFLAAILSNGMVTFIVSLLLPL